MTTIPLWSCRGVTLGNLPATRLDDAIQALKFASTPLLQGLDDPEMRSAARGDTPA